MKQTTYEITFNKYNFKDATIDVIGHVEHIARDDENYLEQLSRRFYQQVVHVKWRSQDDYERDIFNVFNEENKKIGFLRITTWYKW